MNFRNIIMWGLIVLLSVGLFNLFQNPNRTDIANNEIPFSKFLEEVDAGRVMEVTIQGSNINGTLSDGSKFHTYSPNYPDLVEKLSDNNVNIVASPPEDKNAFITWGASFLVPNVITNWRMDFFHEADARRKRRSHGVWKIKSKIID